jgi:hypothetical protein
MRYTDKRHRAFEFEVGDYIYLHEGAEKASRGGEWEPIKIPCRNLLISQIEPDDPLFQHDQDHRAIEQLLALRTGLGTAVKT